MLDVAFEDLPARTQDSLESAAVQFDALEEAAGDDRRGTRAVQQKRYLTCVRKIQNKKEWRVNSLMLDQNSFTELIKRHFGKHFINYNLGKGPWNSV